ncbi:MAG: NAD-dependent deacylase [Chloroflexi bacterium]|nr:NAD-dependent deacylase [Chloroflexota bacterium]
MNILKRKGQQEAAIQKAADLLVQAQHAVALTGAGISTPSGIPDFRTPGKGMWEFVDPVEVASIWSYREQPERFYRWIRPLLEKMEQARPNPAHHALADMERWGVLRWIITQNIDSLHQAAGSRNVLEVHGHTRTATCLSCGYQTATDTFWEQVKRGEIPRCPQCGGLMKPDVVLFGELLPPEALIRAQEAALRADLMLIVGSSLEVMPAADLPRLTKRSGGKLIVVNLGPTSVDHLAEVRIRGDVAEILPKLAQAVRERLDEHPGA